MSSNHGPLKRDLIGGTLNINDKLIVDKHTNVYGNNGTFKGDLTIKNINSTDPIVGVWNGTLTLTISSPNPGLVLYASQQFHADGSFTGTDSADIGQILIPSQNSMGTMWEGTWTRTGPLTYLLNVSNIISYLPTNTTTTSVQTLTGTNDTIAVASTVVYPDTGVICIVTSTGVKFATYTGVTSTTFTGCNGATGDTSIGGFVGIIGAVSSTPSVRLGQSRIITIASSLQSMTDTNTVSLYALPDTTFDTPLASFIALGDWVKFE